MMKKYLYGAAILVALSAPISAEELFVRNRVFGDAYFVGGTTYVPVSGFLKAVDVSWSDSGSTVSLGSGDSPESAFDSEAITVTQGEKSIDLTGVMRNGKLYVPVKNLANFVGYTVIHNSDTGIVDVVKTREYNSADAQAEKDVAATKAAESEARKASREARQAKEKAYADAKAKAKGESTEAEEAEGEESAEAKPAESGVKEGQATAGEDEEKPKEPPKANVVVLSSEATPNYYTGEVIFRAVIQNQGFAPAENLTAQLTATGPDGKVWLTKNYHHAPLAVDGRWEIEEKYNHRLKSAMPRGDFNVVVTPKFTSGIVPETK